MVTYNNAVLTLTKLARPDPFAIQGADGRFYMTFTAGNRIEVLSANSMLSFRTDGTDKKITTVWGPPPDTMYSGDLWAPELHPIGGRWYVYFAADNPKQGNISHRMYVLGGPPANLDPTIGHWEFLGGIRGMPEGQWAIDGTVFPLKNGLYFCYSGWPAGERHSDLIQELWLIRLATPTQANSQAVRICRPEHGYEFTHDGNGAHGINEGPQWLVSPNGVWAGIVYSCAGSWTNNYKMNVLQFQGGDPLNAGSWRKETRPLLQTSPDGFGPWGPGHGNFVNLGGEVVAVYHATDGPADGWGNRRARVQRVGWTQHGPTMGGYVGVLTEDVDAFTKQSRPSQPPQTQHHGFHALFTGIKQKLHDR